MLHFEETTGTFYLENDEITYAFTVENGLPEHLWFGARIPRDDLRYTRWISGTSCDAQLPGRASENHIAAELPTYGRGDFREPMLGVRDENGNALLGLTYKGYRVIPEPRLAGLPSTFGGETLEVTFEDAEKGLRAVLLYTLFADTAALTRSMRLENIGGHTLTLERAFSFAFDLPAGDYEALTLAGSWAAECAPERTTLRHGIFTVNSKRVTSSATQNPFLAVMTADADEAHGDVYGVNLVYSSSYRLLAETAQHGRVRVAGGINDFGFTWELRPGDTFQTPEAVIAYSGEGLGHLSRIFHDTYRAHLIPARFATMHRPVVINNWEATYFHFDRDKLFAIIDAAAGTGIDTFVLDDGWFGKRDDDHSGLGDWFVNTKKLVGGLDPIIEHAHEKGMKFGLWFEPEMVNPDSDLYRAHPDWAIHAPGYPVTEARNQLVLDLTRDEVRDYIVKSVNDILDTHAIDYVKWDCNRYVTEMYSSSLPAERQGEFAHRYALGLYDLFERIVAAHPGIFFEGCSSGGARFDPAILAYFPQIWTSDDTDAAMRTRIQWGTSFCYPLSAMSCHASVCPNHTTRRVTPWATRARIAHLGATGYELDTSVMSAEDLTAVPGQVADYHAMEDLVLSGDFYRLADPYGDRQFAVALVAKDGSRAHVTVMQLLRVFNCPPLRLTIPALTPDALYRVESSLGETLTLSGKTLSEVGLIAPVHRMADFESLTYTVTRL